MLTVSLERLRFRVEGGEEAVACYIEFAVSEPGQLAAHQPVVLLHQSAPATVAQWDRDAMRTTQAVTARPRELRR